MSHSDNELKWVPWKKTLSVDQQKQIQARRDQKSARSDMQVLHSILWEETPQLLDDEIRGSPFAIGKMQETRRNAFALTNQCHLANYKILDTKFMEYYTMKYTDASGLRSLHLEEAMDADESLHKEIYKLVNEEGWSLDDALHEISTVRNEVRGLMQPRPKTTGKGKGSSKNKTASVQSGKGAKTYGNARPSDWGGQPAKKGAKRQSPYAAKGSGKGASTTTWDPSWHTTTNENPPKQVCFRYHTTGCSAGARCKFQHVCPVPTATGGACGQRHAASQH